MTCVCVLYLALPSMRSDSGVKRPNRLRLAAILSLSAAHRQQTNKYKVIKDKQLKAGTTQTTKTKKEQTTHAMQLCTYYKYIFSVINLLLGFVSSVWSCGMFETGGVWTVWANSSPLKLILVGVVAIGASCFVLSPLLTIPSHDNP